MFLYIHFNFFLAATLKPEENCTCADLDNVLQFSAGNSTLDLVIGFCALFSCCYITESGRIEFQINTNFERDKEEERERKRFPPKRSQKLIDQAGQ